MNTLYELHIGCPEGSEQQMARLTKADHRWKRLEFARIAHGTNSDRYDAHDVPGGVRHLATMKLERLSSVVREAERVIATIGSNPDFRLEVEKVIRAGDKLYSPDDVAESDAGLATLRGLKLIGDFPPFESHISARSKDGTEISLDEMIALCRRLDVEFNEMAITTNCSKVIMTSFYTNDAIMDKVTTAQYKCLDAALAKRFLLKSSTERIVVCAGFT